MVQTFKISCLVSRHLWEVLFSCVQIHTNVIMMAEDYRLIAAGAKQDRRPALERPSIAGSKLG